MSVITTADEKRQSAKDHIQSAVKDLSVIAVDGVWGSDDFTPQYKIELFKAMAKLTEIYDSI